MDKEFGFISEGIGSRLVVVSMAESPEVEIEVQKAKDKPKKIETVNLDELVDVKGWKAVGNRLSEYKVSKATLVQDEETGLEDGDEENDLIEATETESGSQSPKKKWETSPETVEDDGQVNLFKVPEKPQHQVQPRPEPKLKVKVEQQALFGAEPKREEANQSQSQPQNKNQSPNQSQNASEEEEVEDDKAEDERKKDSGKSFGVGDTIEFDI